MFIKLAKVVLLPLPVGPVTSTKPLCFSAKFFKTSGSPKVSKSGICDVIVLIAIAKFSKPKRNRTRYRKF